MDLSKKRMSACDFYIHAVVDDVAVGFYVEASSHTEASNEAMREAQRRFPGKRFEIRVVEKLRSSNSV
jgi:ribosomal protein L16/L10AE